MALPFTSPTDDLEMPAAAAPPEQRLNWLLGAQSNGEAWLQAQRPAASWDAVRSKLSESGETTTVAGLSNLTYNKTKRSVREIVASLSSFRHVGEFKPRWDKSKYAIAQVLSRLDDDWMRRLKIHRRIREVVQYGVAFGTGYFYQIWDPGLLGSAGGDIDLQALAPDKVTFVQLPQDHDIQKAYVVTVTETLPINNARAKYAKLQGGAFSKSLVAERGNPNLIQKGVNKVQQFLAPALRVAGLAQKRDESSFPTVDIFHSYILDQSINESGFPVDMGTPLTNWHYTVPSLGDPMPTPLVNPATGQPFTRPAEREDCLLYPTRRLAVYSRTALGYDGPSPWWHGRAPVARASFIDWAWEALGGSTPAEIMPIEQGVTSLMRMMEDSWAARLDPPVLYDRDKVAENFAAAFNPRMAGARAGADINTGKVLEYPVQPDTYNVPQGVYEFIAQQEQRMDYLSGSLDLSAIMKAKQIPGADTQEKLMEMAGPIVQDMIRALEEPLTELGQQRLALYLQFYTRARVITVDGPPDKQTGAQPSEQFTPELFAPPVEGETPQQNAARRRKLLDQFVYEVSESGVNEIHRMTTRLFYLQLMKLGFPISWWTMAEICQIPNFGPAPEGTETEMQRWVAQKRMEVELMSYAQQLAAAQGLGGPAQTPTADGVSKGGAKQPGGGQSGAGRPPTNAAPPKIEQKDGGTRSTVTTSGD